MSRDFKVQLKQKKNISDVKNVHKETKPLPMQTKPLPMQTKPLPMQTKPSTNTKQHVPEVERPNSKDHEGGFERKINESDIKPEHLTSIKTTIDSYLNVLSKKLGSDFYWKISADAYMLNIYDGDDKLYKSKKLNKIHGDSYYVLFDETATDKLKAHKAIAYVDWFL